MNEPKLTLKITPTHTLVLSSETPLENKDCWIYSYDQLVFKAKGYNTNGLEANTVLASHPTISGVPELDIEHFNKQIEVIDIEALSISYIKKLFYNYQSQNTDAMSSNMVIAFQAGATTYKELVKKFEFTREDIIKAIIFGTIQEVRHGFIDIEEKNQFISSLKPKEWKVESFKEVGGKIQVIIRK